MRAIKAVSVVNSYPESIGRLEELVGNLYWTWHPQLREFFRSTFSDIWQRVNHSPLKGLALLSRERIQELADDEEFCARYRTALQEMDSYLQGKGWYRTAYADRHDCIAYFSAEFGLHESVPLYSGGLGVLSGDHTKSASDLDLPFVGVGLLYQMGYFRQRLSLDGAQLESYEYNDPSVLPVTRVLDDQGHPLTIVLEFPEGPLHIGLWTMNVGRVPVYLLDTNLQENSIPLYRDITGYLYGGDKEMRIMQEIVLGIGGMRMLEALGIEPTVTHCNEGHSAFLLLERSLQGMKQYNLSFSEAVRLTAAGSVFTTHTPVPAGHDVFPADMVERYLGSYRLELKLSQEEFMGLGRAKEEDENEGFSMTILALKLTSGRNGVSQLHGEVSRKMWHELWPNFSQDEMPIVGITNGVHTRSFVSDRMGELFDHYLGAEWRERIAEGEIWKGAEEIPNRELWGVKQTMRHEMIDYLRDRLQERRAETYTRSETGRDISAILDPEALTIGFARRFATYKRATLLFQDRDRAYRLFTDPDRPVQLLIAGKAHPKDEAGKKLIREIFAFVRETGLEHRVMFIEDYDIGVARAMVQGCDVWLNTPRRPMEASGTSGMKAAVNGTLNLSIPDGWFPEGFDGQNGFQIGDEREFINEEYQDEIESRQLYRILEERVVPMFYDRDRDGLPNEWIAMQKHSIATMAGLFSSDRMVREYTEQFYIPASDRFTALAANNAQKARNLTAWLHHVESVWPDARILDVNFTPDQNLLRAGDRITVTVQVALGRLAPENVSAQALVGPPDLDGKIPQGEIISLPFAGVQETNALYRGEITLKQVGQTGLTVRLIPAHPDTMLPADVGLVTWK